MEDSTESLESLTQDIELQIEVAPEISENGKDVDVILVSGEEGSSLLIEELQRKLIAQSFTASACRDRYQAFPKANALEFNISGDTELVAIAEAIESILKAIPIEFKIEAFSDSLRRYLVRRS